MKKKKEIIEKWRDIGFLNGLKNNSINEWRCAKSFNDMVDYLIKSNQDTDNFSFILFPFIRRALTTGKKRLYRFIDPNEIMTFINTVTLGDIFKYIIDITTKKDKISYKIIYNINELDICNDIKIIDFFNSNIKNDNDKIKRLKTICNNIIDIEAEIIAYSSEYFVEIKKRK
jgi:hypothetical protein